MIDAYRRSLKLFLVALAIAAGAVAPAHAGGCGQAVIDDWADNGSVDGSYSAGCYGEAIDNLPEDLAAYSSAADDIAGARQDELQGGGGGSAPSSSGGGSAPTSADEEGGGGGGQDSSAGGTKKEEPGKGSGGDGEGANGVVPADQTPQNEAEAAGNETSAAAPSAAAFESELGDSGGGSLPVAVIVVISVLGAGLAAGAAFLFFTHRPSR